MIFSAYNENFNKNSCFIVDKNFEYGILFSSDQAKSMLDMVNAAPSARMIDYQKDDDIFQFEKLQINASVFGDLAFRKDDIDYIEYTSIVKRAQSELVKYGLPVLEIYGISINDYLYGRDMGFKIEYEFVTVFTNFSLIRTNNYGRLATGFSAITQNYTYDNHRKSGDFKSNVFVLNNYIPNNVTKLFGDVSHDNIRLLPNLSIAIRNLWSNVDSDRILIIDLANNQVAASILFTDAIKTANKIRSEGSKIFKKISTNPKLTSGYSNIATAKVLSADAVEKLQDLVIINTSNDSALISEAEFIENKHRFLSVPWPSESDQYKLAQSAGTSVALIGNLNILKEKDLDTLIESVLSLTPSHESNKSAHFLTSEDGKIIGYMEGSSKLVYSSQTDISRTNISDLIFEDYFNSKDEFKNIAVEFQDVHSVIRSLEKEKEKYISLSSLINYDNIIANIKKIDSYVSNCFNSLASLIASQELISARAATYIKAVDMILKMPLKTAYGAIGFGSLAEFIDIKILGTGESIVTVNRNLSHLIPYRTSIYTRQCYKDWCILNSDPGLAYENDILVGSAYASSISDLNGKYLTVQTKEYIKTNRQTRGNGKSEQVVVPLTKLEPRVVMRFDDLLTQCASFINTLLNNDIMKANAQIALCIESCTSAVKRYAEMRKPFLDSLLLDQEYKERIFFCDHSIALAKLRIPDELTVNYNDMCYVEDSESNLDVMEQNEVTLVNSYINLIDKNDVHIDTAPLLQRCDEYREKIDHAISYFIEFVSKQNFSVTTPYDNDKFEELIEYFNSRGVSYLIAEMYLNTYSIDDEMYNILKPGAEHSINGTVKEKIVITKSIEKNDIDDAINSNPDNEKSTESDNECTFFESVYGDRYSFLEITDEDEEAITNAINRVNEAYEDRLRYARKLRDEFIEAISSQHKFISLSEDVSIEQNDNKIFLTDTNMNNYIVLDVYRERVDAEVEDSGVIHKNVLGEKIRIVYNRQESRLCLDVVDPQIYIGTLCYDLKIFLRQFEIYQNLPCSKKIIDKLKYSLFMSTDISDDVLVTKIRDSVGLNESLSLGKFLSQSTFSIDYKLNSIILCMLVDPIKTVAWILASQSDTFGIFLAENGLSLSTASSIIGDLSRISK